MGGFGEVHLGYYSEAKVAIKSIKTVNGKNKNDIEAIENELLLMNYLGLNPNILHSYGFWKDHHNHTLHIVLEFSPFGSLADILYNETFPEFKVRLILGWLSDLALALEFIHSKKVKHRDVKSENLLVFPDMKVKLSDFGLAKQHSSYKSSATTSSSGTTAFMAPEVLSRQGSGFASDIYSWAMTSYQMIMRQVPAVDKSSSDLMRIALNKVQSEFTDSEKQFPQLDRFRMLLSRCIEVVSSSRPSANYVVESLKDILSSVGGDPRRKVNSEDRNYLRQIENMATELSESKIYAKHEERKPKEQITAAPVSAVALASSTGTATTVSAISDVSALSNEKSLSPSPSKQSTTAIPLESLNSEESIELLISLGLSANIRNRVKELNAILDGTLLQLVSDVETFQELEGGTISNFQMLGLKASLVKLRKLQETGIPLELLNDLKQRIADEEKKRIDEEARLAMKRAEEAEKLIVAERDKKEKLTEQKLEEQEKQKEDEKKKAAEQAARLTVKLQEQETQRERKDEMAEQSLPMRADRNGKADEVVKTSHDLPRVSSDSHSGYVRSLSWDLVGSKIASRSADKTVKIWDGKSLELLETLEGHSNIVNSVAWNHDGTKLASGSGDSTIKVWDVLSGQILGTLLESQGEVYSVAWNHDDSRIASISSRRITIWDGKTLNLERTLDCKDCCSSFSWSHDGSKLVSGSSNKTIQIWDSFTLTLLRTLTGHFGWVRSVSWSHDDSKIVSGSDDKTVRIWNSITGDLMKTLEGHTRGVTCVAFSHDDRKIASCSYNEKKLIIWNSLTGKILNSCKLDGNAFASAWNSDDSEIVVSDGQRAKLVSVS
jgi:WD40 repeat protein/serine/threonine protein kinase